MQTSQDGHFGRLSILPNTYTDDALVLITRQLTLFAHYSLWSSSMFLLFPKRFIVVVDSI